MPYSQISPKKTADKRNLCLLMLGLGAIVAWGHFADSKMWRRLFPQPYLELRQNNIGNFAFSPDGKLLAAFTDGWKSGSKVSKPAILRLWNTQDGQLLWSSTAHLNYGRTLTFSPDGKLLATCGQESPYPTVKQARSAVAKKVETSKIWDVRNGTLLRTLPQQGSHYSNIVRFLPDSRTLLAVGDTIKYWDITTGKILREHLFPQFPQATGDSLRTLDISPDARLAAVRTPECSIPIKSLKPRISAQDIFQDAGGQVQIWDIQRNKLLHVFAQTSAIDASFSPDAKLIAFTRRNNEKPTTQGKETVWPQTLFVYEIGSGKKQWSVDLGLSFASGTMFSPDGKIVVSDDGTKSRYWDVYSGQEKTITDLHSRSDSPYPRLPRWGIVAPDGASIATIEPGVVKLWNISTK